MGKYAKIMQVVYFLIFVCSTNILTFMSAFGHQELYYLPFCAIVLYLKCPEKRGQETFFLTFVCFCPLQQERKKDELKEVEDVDIRVFPPPCVFMRPPITRPSPPSPPRAPPSQQSSPGLEHLPSHIHSSPPHLFQAAQIQHTYLRALRMITTALRITIV